MLHRDAETPWHMLPPIKREYERWLALSGSESGCSGANGVSLQDVLRAHFLLIDYFVQEGEAYGGIGPRSLALLRSAVDRPFVGFGHRWKWETDIAKCATLFYGLIMNHPFHDCNKRTAFVVLLYHLGLVGRTPDAQQKEFENLAVKTADHHLQEYRGFVEGDPDAEVLAIAGFLRRNTRKVDKRYYAITYNELQTILNTFNCRLVNPHGNFIDVEKLTDKRTLLGNKPEYKRVAPHIGFPGWTKQVTKSVIKEVRRKTGLTHKNGCDSQVFFRGANPMSSLIDKYRGPLKRLADR